MSYEIGKSDWRMGARSRRLTTYELVLCIYIPYLHNYHSARNKNVHIRAISFNHTQSHG